MIYPQITCELDCMRIVCELAGKPLSNFGKIEAILRRLHDAESDLPFPAIEFPLTRHNHERLPSNGCFERALRTLPDLASSQCGQRPSRQKLVEGRASERFGCRIGCS